MTARRPYSSGFIASLVGCRPAEPGELIHLARETDRCAADFFRSGGDPLSDEGWNLYRLVFDHRMALVGSKPSTDLDLLMLAFTGRQAVRALQHLPVDESHDGQRGYWLEELDTALRSMQRLFEETTGHSLDDLGFTLGGGTTVN